MKLKHLVLDDNHLLEWCRASFCGQHSVNSSWEWHIQVLHSGQRDFKPFFLQDSGQVTTWCWWRKTFPDSLLQNTPNRPCILTLWSSRRTVLVKTGELRCTFNSAVIWAAVVLCFLDTIWVSTRTSLSDSFLLRPQFILLDVVRPSWWYADITLDIVALDTSQRLAVLVTDAPARCAPTICPLLNSDMSPIMQYFEQNCALTLLIEPSHSALTGAMCN